MIVGGQLFNGYRDHPRVLVDLPKLKIESTAAGRYQLLRRYYDAYKKTLGLKDPLAGVLWIGPSCFALRNVCGGGFPERRDAGRCDGRSSPTRKGILTGLHHLPRGSCRLPRLG